MYFRSQIVCTYYPLMNVYVQFTSISLHNSETHSPTDKVWKCNNVTFSSSTLTI